ncbi:hypothetical protein [Methylocaldum sp. GT1TLB]|uniref:hypothetical protein n=1 Tax=Methylocaldum sp. GT1TLB TaxID=3438965 RepID=UPI003DA0D5A3
MAVHELVSKMKRLPKTASIVLAGAVFLAGCGESDKPAEMFQGLPQKFQEEQKFEKEQTLRGTVNDEKEPVIQGKVVATDEKGNTIAETSLEGSNRFSIVIPAGTALPILLKAYREGSEPLIVAIVDSFESQYNINPKTTAVAEKAKSLGGYTRKNLMAAAMMSSTVPEEDKTTSGFRGDPTKRYGGWH